MRHSVKLVTFCFLLATKFIKEGCCWMISVLKHSVPFQSIQITISATLICHEIGSFWESWHPLQYESFSPLKILLFKNLKHMAHLPSASVKWTSYGKAYELFKYSLNLLTWISLMIFFDDFNSLQEFSLMFSKAYWSSSSTS